MAGEKAFFCGIGVADQKAVAGGLWPDGVAQQVLLRREAAEVDRRCVGDQGVDVLACQGGEGVGGQQGCILPHFVGMDGDP